MKKIDVKLQQDYIQRITRVKKPILAISELVWNALDADATEIRVVLEVNKLGVLSAIRISDNGHGIEYKEGIESFANLGGSKKLFAKKSKSGRLLHGKAGRGRFRAYALGPFIEWKTRYTSNGHIEEFNIIGDYNKCMSFMVGESVPSKTGITGTEVIIDTPTNHPSLFKDEALLEFTEQFALYLQVYPNVKIWFNGKEIETKKLIANFSEYPLPILSDENGKSFSSNMSIIEWKKQVERSMYLCNSDGFPLDRMTPGIHAPRFNFTAYLRSDYLQVVHDNNALDIIDLDITAQKLLDDARQQLRTHFREQEAKNAVSLVEQWKRDKIYPYTEPPKNIIDIAERQVFDVIALHVNEYIPGFSESEIKSKKFALTLLKQSLMESPAALKRIMTEVLELGVEKQNELAQLLEKTSLTAIINASKTIADRIDFIAGLEILIYDYKKRLLERSQLHKILEDHTWIFGEQYHLMASDESLTQILKKHDKLLGREIAHYQPVLREDDTEGIIDLMLSRTLTHNEPDGIEHLIVELKRPLKKIDSEVISQIRSYAAAVASDERFRDTNTKWVFWAISNEIEDSAKILTKPKDRPEGQIEDLREPDIKIWVKTWSQLLVQCRSRLKFFQDSLNYSASRETAIDLLRKMHDKYLPEEIQEESIAHS